MRNGIFADRLFLKKLIHLALPIAFQNLMLAAVAAADAFMLGNVEQNAMAAVFLWLRRSSLFRMLCFLPLFLHAAYSEHNIGEKEM